MSDPKGNSEFFSPETLNVEDKGKLNSLFPAGPVITYKWFVTPLISKNRKTKMTSKSFCLTPTGTQICHSFKENDLIACNSKLHVHVQVSINCCLDWCTYACTFILVPRGHAPFGQHQESRPLAWSNTGSPRFTDFPSLCTCSESSLTNLIGSGLNLLCFQSHSKPEHLWTWPEVAILGADQKECGLWGWEWCTLYFKTFWQPWKLMLLLCQVYYYLMLCSMCNAKLVSF